MPVALGPRGHLNYAPRQMAARLHGSGGVLHPGSDIVVDELSEPERAVGAACAVARYWGS
jgi:hypothetical protein